jgi:TonB family protein
MAPTLKDSSSRFSSTSVGPTGAVTTADEAKSSQPVALEVPVTVNGARAVEGSDKREPFSENTTTVLIFANGAVIRLNSGVTPGQLLFLTNEKIRKEVVCQVVKSKNYRNNSGYVELEFTEPVSGFWGMRFPGERPGTQTAPRNAAKPSADLSAVKNLMIDANAKLASPPAATPEAPGEFKTEIKADSRPGSKADFLAPSEASTVAPRLESNLLQEQLSALLSSEPAYDERTSPAAPPKEEALEVEAEPIEIAAQDTVAVVAAMPAASIVSATPVPKSVAPPSKSSFEDEEVKIPAWLQPLARNESVMAPTPVEDLPAPATVERSPVPSEIAALPRHIEPVRRPSSSAAVFGNALLGETAPAPAHPSTGSGKGIWIGALAAAVLVAAGAAWYFRDSLGYSQRNSGAAQLVPATALPSSQSSLPNSAATSSAASSPNVESASPDFSSQSSKPPAEGRVINSPSSFPASGKLQTAAISERITKAPPSVDATKAPSNEENQIVVVGPEKRPALGTVHLAKPKVSHSTGGQVGGTIEPTLEAHDQIPIADSSFSSDLITGSKQPAAPAARVEVGGDVRTARMISSIPPVYPALAKAQHISGEVRIDALIDANGRVTTMKVVSGPTLLHQAAMDALRQWKYQPATLDGKPVAMHLAVTIQFRLQ